MKYFGILLFICYTQVIQTTFAQIPIKDLPGISHITFHEKTVAAFAHVYDLEDIEVNTRLVGQLNNGNRDFEGTPGQEFYDVFFSDADGAVNPNGAFATIEARFDPTGGGGGLNILEVEFHFMDGSSVYGNHIASFVSNGTNYIPGSEEFAADCDITTWSTMGNTNNLTIRLRVTIGLLDVNSIIEEDACTDTGYEIVVGGIAYNELNPTGISLISDGAGCDSAVYVNLTFYESYLSDIYYEGCTEDGHSIVVNGTIYNESNPSGVETFLTDQGCDSVFVIDLNFLSVLETNHYYEGCEDDGYTVVINGTTYDQNNPFGTEMLLSSFGCDSIINIELIYHPASYGEELYTGCMGDGYSVSINGMTYDEDNPVGMETLEGSNGCDSIVTIDLTFNQHSEGLETYSGCMGDQYSIFVNGTVYDESNPSGEETLLSWNGCDSVVTIDLDFHPATESFIDYEGCQGDGHAIVLNGITYDEDHPVGFEVLNNQNGCDSVVYVDMTFYPAVIGNESYTGCSGSGYEVLVNGTTYNESNPSGEEILISDTGCDSVVTIDLVFADMIERDENYVGCSGDGYEIIVNGTLYDEFHPTGTEVLIGQGGCDSIIMIDLTYHPQVIDEISYQGCSGDGFELIVNDNIYDENNPVGEEVVNGSIGCDTLLMINLTFLPVLSTDLSYTGCSGDGHMILLNGTLYDELNPTGIEHLVSSNGCDSIVNVSMIFHSVDTTSILSQECVGSGNMIVVNGTTYDESNPIGEEVLLSSIGCDSVVLISLVFNDTVYIIETFQGCSGDDFFVVVNGTTYDEANPTGTELLAGNVGCDTLVNINLAFSANDQITLTYSGCSGDNYETVVNGTAYNESNPEGTEILQNTNGCDSIVDISLEFLSLSEYTLEHTSCLGDDFFVVVNNTVYDQNHPMGTEILVAANGCDSIVTISLFYESTLQQNLTYTGCEGDGHSIIVNGIIYNESNPSGSEILQSTSGCDSVVTISMIFDPASEGEVSYSGCSGDSYFIVVNGTVYNESHPVGTELLQTMIGCDSIVHIALTFAPVAVRTLEHEGCVGDGFSVFINGNTYDELNPVGEEQFLGSNGCDSLVSINLIFHDFQNDDYTYSGCSGDGFSIEINSIVYDQSNPVGIEHMTTALGCDSIINISLTYASTTASETTYSGCIGDGYTLFVNGNLYNESNPLGNEILQSMSGCDSIVHIVLSFEDCSEDTTGCAYFIPNVFSANSDNVNDQFKLYLSSECVVSQFEINIYDRWGELIYNSLDIGFEWNGMLKGQPLNPGVFVYVATFMIDGEMKQEYGDITLLR